MKKDFYKWFAIFCGGLTMTAMTACNDYDEIANEGKSDNVENCVAPPAQPTTDAMTVTVSGATYVFNGNYTGEAKALVNRVTTPAASLQENGVKNIIIHGSRIASLTNKEAADLLLQMSRGASLVVADPTADNIKMLAKRLKDVIDDYSIGGNNEEVRSEVNQIMGSRILHRIKLWNDGLIESAFASRQDQDKSLSLMAIRNEDTYMVPVEPQDETDSITVRTLDENRNLKEEVSFSYVNKSVMTDYHYGIKVDNLAQWLNTPNEDPVAKENSRQAAAKMMATRAGGRAEEYLDKIAESIDYTLSLGFQLDGPKGHSPFHDCEVKYRIWTAYSGEKKCDVYCVTMDITAYNQKLNCGPSAERSWIDANGWSSLGSIIRTAFWPSGKVYGPYMKKVSAYNWLKDGNLPVTVEEYAPMNSTSGGQTVSNGFSFTLGGSVSVKSGGPEAGISSSMQWSRSVSKFNADLTMKAKVKPDGEVGWAYEGGDPDAHISGFGDYHDNAKSIQYSTCTLQHAWVWTVKGSSSSSVTLDAYATLRDRYMTYSKGFLKCIPHYITQFHSSREKITIPCPPRYHQNWSMNVESKDVDASKLKEIESFLTSHLGQYFMPTCVFSTVKPEHKRATGVADSDEVAVFVSKCKQAFASTSGRELLREAGKRAGLSDNGSFTIVWRHTDLGVNSDREEFTFNMN